MLSINNCNNFRGHKQAGSVPFYNITPHPSHSSLRKIIVLQKVQIITDKVLPLCPCHTLLFEVFVECCQSLSKTTSQFGRLFEADSHTRVSFRACSLSLGVNNVEPKQPK